MTEKQHIRITVFPEAPKVRVIKQEEAKYDVYVTARAEGGAANNQMMAALRDSLSITGQIRIVTGHKSQNKIIEVAN